jgi:hypothetical protein
MYDRRGSKLFELFPKAGVRNLCGHVGMCSAPRVRPYSFMDEMPMEWTLNTERPWGVRSDAR